MDCTCIRHTELPHASKLFTDLVYHSDRVASFYRLPPFDPDSYAIAAREVNLSAERRAELVDALRAQNGLSASLDLLAKPETVAVVTGQQVGLFSGPAYTIYKALTAARLARELTDRGIPAVPVFWLATEDHDFAEVNHTWIFNAAHQPIKLDIDGAVSGNQPVGNVPLTSVPIESLREALRGLPFGDEMTERVSQAYRPGATLGLAFSALLRDLLGKFDILQIDPMQPAVRALAAPVIRDAISKAPELKRLLLERNRELTEAGYHAQVHVEDETSLFFLLENGRRTSLRRQNGDYLSSNRRLSSAELAERADSISPNALLRPVVQDSILPTVAYIGGPAELAYLAQSEVLYRALLGRMPVGVPRSGFTVIDQRSRKLMARYGLRLNDFFHGEEALRERIAAALVPPRLNAVLNETKVTVSRALERMETELTGFDPTMHAAARKSHNKIAYQLSKTERKIARQILARDEKAARDAASLIGLIYPHKHLQERLYSIIPFLAAHGLDLIDRLYDNIQLECPDHRVLVV